MFSQIRLNYQEFHRQNHANI